VSWSIAALWPATQLFIADHRQYWSQPLIVGYGTLIDLTDLVEVR
jgi:UDP-N-acetyl-D-mannosaminuronic acid transferase (WecB/TagA/CpsF family)